MDHIFQLVLLLSRNAIPGVLETQEPLVSPLWSGWAGELAGPGPCPAAVGYFCPAHSQATGTAFDTLLTFHLPHRLSQKSDSEALYKSETDTTAHSPSWVSSDTAKNGLVLKYRNKI